MRKLYIALLIIVITIVIISVVITAPIESSPSQRVAVVSLGVLGGLAAIAEVVGLLDRLRSQWQAKVPKRPEGKNTKQGLPPIIHKFPSESLKVIKTISDTPLWSVYLVENSSGALLILKKGLKVNFHRVDYSKFTLDPTKFAIPINVYEDESYIYEVLNHRQGFSLEEVIHINNGGIKGQLLESWTKELLELLSALHTHNPPIVYRDLKPDNVLVETPSLKLTLLDLSTAIFYEPGSKFNQVGTQGYTPPEQAEGYPIPASDLYALAATIFKMNSGMHPPHYFDRLRGKSYFSLTKAAQPILSIYPSIGSVDASLRPANAQAVLHTLSKYKYGTSMWIEPLEPIKLPNQTEIEQKLWTDGGKTSITI